MAALGQRVISDLKSQHPKESMYIINGDFINTESYVTQFIT